MQIAFSKLHGSGNDYVYVNCMQGHLPSPEALARYVSIRRFSVGADGLILILPSDVADFRMRIFNADGSEGKMCGNGIRCVGKYVYDRGLTDRLQLTVETLGGIRTLWLHPGSDGRIAQVTVDMGQAILRPKDIPVCSDLKQFVAQPVQVPGQTLSATCVSMGNPHCVIFVNHLEDLPLETLGPQIEHHPLFPDRVNVEFAKVINKTMLEMRVWERGSGETFACGTGACAAVVAAVLNGFCARGTPVRVRLRGGQLTIFWQKDGVVTMQGPAAHVYDGVLDYPEQEDL